MSDERTVEELIADLRAWSDPNAMDYTARLLHAAAERLEDLQRRLNERDTK